MDRYKITGLLGYKISKILFDEEKPEYLIIWLSKGAYRRKVSVHRNQLFDTNGNWFNTDMLD